MKLLKKEKIIPIAYILLSIIFVLPSIIYLVQNKTLYRFNIWFDYLFGVTSKELQTIAYIAIFAGLTFIYVYIIKNRNKIFKNIEGVIKYVAIIGAIYILAIPFTCSDVFYYMGVGRLDSEYNQNPYYTSIRDYVKENQENNEQINKDSVIKQGNLNYWSNTTVVYGPVWQLICKVVGFLSFGNLEFGLLIFKIINLIIHIINAWLIYKLTGKKIYAIIYGLNPFVLLEGIMCVHNDIFVVMFTLIALYFMKNKKLWISMVALALATCIKYFTILLLPFIIIYYFKEEKPSIRFAKCIKYGFIFLIALIIPYLFYIRDINVLSGLVTQQGKIAKSWYVVLCEYFPNIDVYSLSSLLLKIFAIIYICTCVVYIFKKKITIKDVMSKYMIFLLAFIFILITQFMPWYLMWVMPIFMWQKANFSKVLIAMGIIAEFANSIFLLNDESYIYGISFSIVLYIGILGYALFMEKQSNKRKINAFKKHLNKYKEV